MITKGERAELRSVVKQQFKVLRSEVLQRHTELRAEADRKVTERFASEDSDRSAVRFLAQEIALEANRKLNDVLNEHNHTVKDGYETVYFSTPRLSFDDGDRQRMLAEMNSGINATVQGALTRLERQEADLLRTLAVGAIESEEAHAFLAGIPTVGELVPAGRVLEIGAPE